MRPGLAAWGLWHSPADALLGVVEQDADDVQEAREQLQGEVEEPDPQAWGGGEQGWGSIPRHPKEPRAEPQHSPTGSDPRGASSAAQALLHVPCPEPQTQHSNKWP